MVQKRLKVEREEGLLEFLLAELPQMSRKKVKNLLAYSQVIVEGKVVKQFNHPLQIGQIVEITKAKKVEADYRFQGVKIIHEDDAIIVINKAAGVLSISGKNPNEPTAYRQLSDYVKSTNPNSRIFIVHRLDRDTSGVMVFAKTEEVKTKLQSNWQKSVKERTYTALVEGIISRDKGQLKSWLTESKTLKVYSSQHNNGGKLAITNYEKIQGNRQFTLLKVNLETGRKNQIRVHMQDLGHSIVGDKKYGATDNPLKRLGLHATSLVFEHPVTGKIMSFNIDAPADFFRLSSN